MTLTPRIAQHKSLQHSIKAARDDEHQSQHIVLVFPRCRAAPPPPPVIVCIRSRRRDPETFCTADESIHEQKAKIQIQQIVTLITVIVANRFTNANENRFFIFLSKIHFLFNDDRGRRRRRKVNFERVAKFTDYVLFVG
jgi:hypothetical protein